MRRISEEVATLLLMALFSPTLLALDFLLGRFGTEQLMSKIRHTIFLTNMFYRRC